MRKRSRQHGLSVKSLHGCKIQKVKPKTRTKTKYLAYESDLESINRSRYCKTFSSKGICSVESSETDVILFLCIKSINLHRKDQTLYTGMVLSRRCKSIYRVCKKKSALRKKLYKAQSSCVIFYFLKYTLICPLVSIDATRKERSHHNQCWDLESTMVCHPGSPMTNPKEGLHHQHPCACSASGCLSSFPCVESSSPEERGHVPLAILSEGVK